ncbi:MAG: ATP-binding protein [Anaerolineaceae bacterium]
MSTQIFPGRYESLAKIASFVRHEAESIGLPHSDVFAVETAVDEAVSNIIEHAYQGEDKGEITCTCLTDPESITIILEDSGHPFDPSIIPQPDLNAPLKYRNDHGLGIFMMQSWMDEVHFEFCQDCNRLVMVKRKEKQA